MFFYIFSFLGLLSSICFILSYNSVKAVLFLILISISLSGLCLVGSAEFLGCLFIVIYVGSVTVLMLFVIMMINVKDITFQKENSFNSFNFILAFLLVFLFNSFTDFSSFYFFNLTIESESPLTIDLWVNHYLYLSNLSLFNIALFTTFYSFALISVGLLLFIAMVGSIFLTVQDYSNFKTQKIYKQIAQSDSLFVTYYSVIFVTDVSFSNNIIFYLFSIFIFLVLIIKKRLFMHKIFTILASQKINNFIWFTSLLKLHGLFLIIYYLFFSGLSFIISSKILKGAFSEKRGCKPPFLRNLQFLLLDTYFLMQVLFYLVCYLL